MLATCPSRARLLTSSSDGSRRGVLYLFHTRGNRGTEGYVMHTKLLCWWAAELELHPVPSASALGLPEQSDPRKGQNHSLHRCH